MKPDPNEHRQERESSWERSQKRADRIALGIALIPIPICVVISWAMGSPPWRARPGLGPGEPANASVAPEKPGPALEHGHR